MLLSIQILFLLLFTSALAEKQRKKLVETVPVAFSIFILLLYVLAFFNRMWLVDFIAPIGIFGLCYFRHKEKSFREIAGQVADPSFLVFVAVVAVGMIAVSARGLTGFDDWNFWGTDIKSIFCLQGYAAKGFNCAPAYGDYPPAMQLVAAWIMHGLGGYREGYIACGYFLIMQVYMAPLLTRIPRRIDVCLAAFIWMFVVFTFGPNIMQGYSPDPLMGIMYGCALVFIFFKEESSGWFEYFNIAAVLSVLILTKSVGIQWAIFAIVFMIGQAVLQKRKFQLKGALWMLLPFCAWTSWYVFCKLFERTTYLTTLLKTGVIDTPLGVFKSQLFKTYGMHIFKSFIKGLFRQFQSGAFLGIGFSIVFLFFAFIAIIVLFYKVHLLDRTEFNWLLLFTIFSGIVEAGILLFSMETMFLGEFGGNPDLGEADSLFKRYGCPYTIGTTMLLLQIVFQRLEHTCAPNQTRLSKRFSPKGIICSVWLAVIAVSIAVAPVGTLWQSYVTYRNDETQIERSMEVRYADYPDMIKTINAINAARGSGNQKICIFKDETVSVDLPGLAYYSVPISLVLENGAGGRVADWSNLARYYGCTAVCFVTDGTDETFLQGIYTDDGEPVVPYTVYYLI